MSKSVFFINDELKIKEYFGEKNSKNFSPISKIDCAYADSKKFDFSLSVFRKISLCEAYKVYLNERKYGSWVKLFLDFKSNFLKKSSAKIIQKVVCNFEKFGAENICPIEFVISNWCFHKTSKWWIFLFKENTNDENFSNAIPIYRIVAGIKKGVLISRFLKIKDEVILLDELFRTVLFMKRFDKIKTVDLFTNLPINLSGIAIFNLNKIEESDVISMLLKFAKSNNIFYPVIFKKSFFLNEKFIKRVSVFCCFVSVLCAVLVTKNVIQYQKICEKNQEIERQIFSKSIYISKDLGIKNFENQISKLSMFLKTIDERNSIFPRLKNSSTKLGQLNFDSLFYKNKTFYLRLIDMKDDEIKNVFGDSKYRKASSNAKNILNFSFNNQKDDKDVSQKKEEQEIIEINL